MNQIEPETGLINFEIGRELLLTNSGEKPVDFATQREVGESSVHYYVRSASEYVTTIGTVPEGYLEMTSPPPTPQAGFSCKRKTETLPATLQSLTCTLAKTSPSPRT